MATLKRAAYILCFILLTSPSIAQGKFKAGLGLNLITNNYENEYLNPYSAFSLNVSYRLLKKEKFSLAAETATSVRLKQSDGKDEIGFATSLPLLAEVDLKKIMLYAGTGPGFIYQLEKTYQYHESTSYPALSNMIGVAFKGKRFLLNVVYPEYNIRVSYHKSLKGNDDAAYMLSFIIFLRSISEKPAS